MPSTESSRNDTLSSFDKLKELEIASLSPTSATDSHFLGGEISLIWPYSSLTRQFSIQLCHSDISKRISKGQIKLIFVGKSAGKVADELMNSGDKLRIALKGSQVVECEPSSISEFDSDWICVWENGALVQINDSAPLQIVADDSADENRTRSASSDAEDDEWIAAVSSPATPTAQAISGNVSIAHSSSSIGTSNVWFTPPDMLRRRPRPSSDDTFSSGAFLEFDDDMAGPLRKRSKHSRSSSEWVYDDSTLQTHSILDGEHVPTTAVSKEASGTNRVQPSSPIVPVIDVTVRPAEPHELLHDENELYRDLMRRKAFEEGHLNGQGGERSILDDISIVTQAGSVVDQESITHEDQDRRSENLEKAQSKLYYEILQAKLQNPGSNSLIASSAATVFDGFTASVEGSDGGKTIDDAKSSKSAEELEHVQHHYVVLESAPEPEGDDVIPRYPGIGRSERVRSPVEESAREYIDYLRDNVDKMSAMEQVELASAQTASKPETAPESPPAEPVRVATAENTVPESADDKGDVHSTSTIIRDLATEEETLADISIGPERSQSLTTTEVIDSQRSAVPVATFSRHEVRLEDVADETDIPDVIGNDELPPNPSSFEPAQEFNEVQPGISSAQAYEFLKTGPPEIHARSFQTQPEGLEVRSTLPQREGTLRSSPPIIKDQVATEPVILQELPSQPKGSFTQTHPEIVDFEDETVDAGTIYNTPLIEAIVTPLITSAHLLHDIGPGPFNAFPALEIVRDEEVVNKDDVIEASFVEVRDDAAVDAETGSVFSNIEKLEVIVSRGDIVYVEDEVVATEVEKRAPEEVAMEHVVGENHAVPISEENISSRSPTGTEANDIEKVDPLMYLMNFETQRPTPLYGEDEEMVDSVANVRDELRALATQALLQQAVSERQADDHDNDKADEEEEEFASQADATSSPSDSGSDDDISVQEEETTEQRAISLSSSGTSAAPTTRPEVIDIDSDTSKESGEDQAQSGAFMEDDGENADFEQLVVPVGEECKEQQDEGGQGPPLEGQIAINVAAISPEEYALQQLDISIGQLEAQTESYLKFAKFANEESPEQYEEQDDDDSYSTSSMLDSEVAGENADSIGAEEERLRELEEDIVDGPTTAKTTSVSIDTVVESNSLKRTHLVTVDYPRGKGSKGEERMPAGLTTPISDYPALDLIGFQYLGDFIGAVTLATPIRWVEVDEDKLKEASGGRQCYVYIYITDPSYPRGETIKVYVSRMFEQALPIVKPGDVVLFRNFYVTMRKSKFVALPSLQSAWAVWKFPSSGDAESTVEVRGPPVEYGEQESLYAKGLRQWYLSTASGTAKESDNQRAAADDK
ncbi:hypothetical protein V1515DRAFT_580410 [Lipomyces mesembrius]